MLTPVPHDRFLADSQMGVTESATDRLQQASESKMVPCGSSSSRRTSVWLLVLLSGQHQPRIAAAVKENASVKHSQKAKDREK